MIRYILLAAFLAVAAFSLSLLPNDADGCAPAPREGYSIRIAEESAIIVWDPVKKIEHFIRSASFDTKSPDFGFLVPTPTVPKLQEVEEAIFKEAAKWIQPKVVMKERIKYNPLLCIFGCSASPSRFDVGGKAAGDKSVRVLAEQKVGGFDSAILEADNTSDLSKWLTDNGYSSDPELQSWLVPYVGAKWKITAFKIIQDPKTGQLASTKPVRMSFAAERPFFPYREPEAKKEMKPRKLDNNQQDERLLNGSWIVESARENGESVFKYPGTNFRFTNGFVKGSFLKDTKLTVDASKNPKWLDLPDAPGIYQFDGDTLYWCRGKAKRPTDFDSKQGLLLVLKREPNRDNGRSLYRGNLNSRMLRVFFVSDSRVDGKLGEAKWHANVPWSDQLSDEQRQQIAKETGVPEGEIPAKAWMTAFEDSASPRPGKDEVYFDPAQDRSPIRPPDIVNFIDTWIPIDVVIIGFIVLFAVGGVIVGKVMRARKA